LFIREHLPRSRTQLGGRGGESEGESRGRVEPKISYGKGVFAVYGTEAVFSQKHGGGRFVTVVPKDLFSDGPIMQILKFNIVGTDRPEE